MRRIKQEKRGKSRENWLISFRTLVCECFGDHFVIAALVDTDIFSTGTLNLMPVHLRVKHLFYSVFVAAEYFTLTNLVVAP